MMNIILALVIALILWIDAYPRQLGWILAGFVVGSITTTVKKFLLLQRLWFIHERIVDWDAVDRTLPG